jgi:hypothetical protein
MRFADYALRLDETHGKRGMNLRDPLAVGPEGQTRRAAGEPNARFARIVDTPRLHLFLERLWPVS